MAAKAVGIGIVLSFLFGELTGLSPGGIVVPGYLALFLDQPLRVAATFAVAAASYGVVRFFSGHIILYGRRRFMAAVLSGYLLGWLLEAVLAAGLSVSISGQDLRVIGYIVPGLIANDMAKQGVLKTVVSALLASVAVRLVLVLVIG